MAGTAISDIMEATKLAKGGVYGNFESKDEICLEALKYLLKSLSDGINNSIADKANAKLKLFAILDFYKERLLKTNTGGCPILNFGTEADDTNPVIKQVVKEAISFSQSRIAGIVNEGHKAGGLRENFDADLFAVKMLTMLEGAILISRIQNTNANMILITDILKAEIEENTL